MNARTAAVTISALIRISLVRSTCCIKAWLKSADTAARFSSCLPQSPSIAFPCHSGTRVSVDPESRDSGFVLRTPRNDRDHPASIERAAEARHGDRHGKEHQEEQGDGVV